MKILLMFALINMSVALCIRMVWLGTLKISKEDIKENTAILVAGMFNQAGTAYSLLDLPDTYEYATANFSNLGFNASFAGLWLRIIAKDKPIFGISIGAKVAAYSGTRQAVLINPCVYPNTLKSSLYWPIKIFSPILEIISVALGLLAFLPIIPTSIAGNYSITLLADQLFWIGYGNPKVSENAKYGIVLSNKDEFLDNTKIIKKIPSCYTECIDTMHGRTADPEASYQYSRAINHLQIPS